MATELHRLARRTLRGLTLMDPVARYRPRITERLFTNPCAPDFGHYPCPLRSDLRHRFASLVASEIGARAPALDERNVLFTPGSTVSIDLVTRAYCEPRVDTLCTLKPTFPVYRHYATAYGVEVMQVPLTGTNLDDFDPSAAAATAPKVVFVCRPTWPLGSLLDLRRVDELCQRIDGLVVVDEAYIEFARAESAAALVDDRRNLIVLRTLSKAWGLAGLRVGAIVGPEALLHPIRLVLDPFSFNVAAQRAVEARLANPEWMRSAVSAICAERDRLASAAAALAVVQQVYPSFANFLCLRIADSRRFMDQADIEQLLLTDISRFVPSAIRISISHPAENDRMIALLRSHDAAIHTKKEACLESPSG